VAVVFGTINVVGGFLVTDRMLEMFKSKPAPRPEVDDQARRDAEQLSQSAGPDAPRR
jgi:NAD(P) transhydrogenase subunit alpha